MAQQTETEQILAAEVTEILEQEKGLAQMEMELAQNPEFKAFLARQKEVKEQIDNFWDRMKDEMIAHDIKSIKGEWGTITIAERLNWDIDADQLPPRFTKNVPDTTKISTLYRLEGKAPRGATPRYSKYITKRIK